MINANNSEERKDAPSDDLTPGEFKPKNNNFQFPDYMNVLGMIFSMCALMMRIKWYDYKENLIE